jgi:hypothetical protein
MSFDRFDICEAWYLYLSHWHNGQGSREYARLSRLLSYFTPRDSLCDECDLSDNARCIYEQLCEDNGVEWEVLR